MYLAKGGVSLFTNNRTLESRAQHFNSEEIAKTTPCKANDKDETKAKDRDRTKLVHVRFYYGFVDGEN